MIYHDLKAIALHVERTGGTARQRYLKKYSKNWDRPYFQHATSDVVREYVGEEKWADYFKFVFVRNPWERFVSFYFHYLFMYELKKTELAGYVFSLGSFGAFVRKPTEYALVSQYSRAIGVDKVYRYEQYETGMQDLCTRLGIPYKEYRCWGSVHGPYTDYYTPETVEIVRGYSQADIEKFGYEFGV